MRGAALGARAVQHGAHPAPRPLTMPLQTGQDLQPSGPQKSVSPMVITPVPWHQLHSTSPDPAHASHCSGRWLRCGGARGWGGQASERLGACPVRALGRQVLAPRQCVAGAWLAPAAAPRLLLAPAPALAARPLPPAAPQRSPPCRTCSRAAPGAAPACGSVWGRSGIAIQRWAPRPARLRCPSSSEAPSGRRRAGGAAPGAAPPGGARVRGCCVRAG